MDIVTELSYNCRVALKGDRVEDLYKYLPKLKQVMGPKSFHDDFLPSLLKDAVNENAIDGFRHIAAISTNFTVQYARDAYENIFSKQNTEMLEIYWEYSKKYLPATKYAELRSRDSLAYAFKAENMKLAKFCVENGANIHAKNYDNTSQFLYIALLKDNLEMTRFVLEQGVTSNPNLTAIRSLISRNNNKNIEPFIELLLEHGHLKADNQTLRTLTEIRHGVTPRDSNARVTYIFEKWMEREQYRYFPAKFRPAMKFQNLTDQYNFAAGKSTSVFHGLAMSDRFQEAIDLAIRDKEKFDVNDLFKKDSRGFSTIDILGGRKKLAVLDDPAVWYNNQDDYYKLVERTPAVYRDQFDTHGMRQAFKAFKTQENIRKNARPLKRRKL